MTNVESDASRVVPRNNPRVDGRPRARRTLTSAENDASRREGRSGMRKRRKLTGGRVIGRPPGHLRRLILKRWRRCVRALIFLIFFLNIIVQVGSAGNHAGNPSTSPSQTVSITNRPKSVASLELTLSLSTTRSVLLQWKTLPSKRLPARSIEVMRVFPWSVLV